jgi:hypothetical protein
VYGAPVRSGDYVLQSQMSRSGLMRIRIRSELFNGRARKTKFVGVCICMCAAWMKQSMRTEKRVCSSLHALCVVLAVHSLHRLRQIASGGNFMQGPDIVQLNRWPSGHEQAQSSDQYGDAALHTCVYALQTSRLKRRLLSGPPCSDSSRGCTLYN